MSRSKNNGTLYILDVSSDETFFERARNCIIQQTVKQILLSPTDEMGVIVAGEGTQNRLNDSTPGQYEALLEAMDMRIPTWNHVRYLESELTSGSEPVDWLDAVVLALDILASLLQSRKYDQLKIVLLTPRCGKVNGLEQLPDIQQTFSDYGIALKVVLQEGGDSTGVRSLLDSVGGTLTDISVLETTQKLFEPPKKKGTPWNKPLTMGSGFEIHCAAYVKVADPKMVPSFENKSASLNERTTRGKIWTKDHKQIEPDVDNVISGYKYGETNVPDQGHITIDFAAECSTFCLLGFSSRSRIMSEFLIGDGCHVVVPQKKYPVSVRKFNALVRTLLESDSVAIVRKMYNKNSSPKCVVLLPGFLDDDPSKQPVFTMIELPFKEDLIELKLPKLEETKVSEEQMAAMSKLIDSMELSSEQLEPFTVDPLPQHVLTALATKGRTDEVVLAPSEHVKKLINVPEEIKVAASEPLKELKELFPLKNVRKQTRMEKVIAGIHAGVPDLLPEADENGAQAGDFDGVGQVTPADDFDALVRRGENFKEASEQLEKVLHGLVFLSVRPQEEKITDAIKMFREHSKIKAPYRFNEWVEKFKKELLQNGREDFFTKVIVELELGLITSEESSTSVRTREEALKFYSLEVAVKEVDPGLNTVFDDMDDMLD